MRIINNEVIEWKRVQYFDCNECGHSLADKWKRKNEDGILAVAKCCGKEYTLLAYDESMRLTKVSVKELCDT
jgi:hypothetical protein